MPFVTVIGGTNIDIQGFPERELREGDSNPGTVTMSAGGVARNIAENLARFGEQVHLLSVFGADDFARTIIAGLERAGVDCSRSRILEGRRSSVYLCILDHTGALEVAVSDMDVMTAMDPAWIDGAADIILRSGLCVVDTNVSEEALSHLADNYPSVPLLLDTVSVAKATRARRCVGRCAAVKPNLQEAEAITGVHVGSDADLRRAADAFHDLGTRLVFISMGRRGVFFSEQGGDGGIAAVPETRRATAQPPASSATRNVSGAGDALTAAIAYGMLHGLTAEQTARYGAVAAHLNARSTEPVDTHADISAIASLAADVTVDRSFGTP